jgi:hypothetical protein
MRDGSKSGSSLSFVANTLFLLWLQRIPQLSQSITFDVFHSYVSYAVLFDSVVDFGYRHIRLHDEE